jgi:hypothetical protein
MSQLTDTDESVKVIEGHLDDLAKFRRDIAHVKNLIARAATPLAVVAADGKIAFLRSRVTIPVDGEILPDRPEVCLGGPPTEGTNGIATIVELRCHLQAVEGGPGTFGEGPVRKAVYGFEQKIREAQ